MLPKLDRIPLDYSSFSQELVNKRVRDSNIHKLKMIKEFLEDDRF